jgi:hypothetical protein
MVEFRVISYQLSAISFQLGICQLISSFQPSAIRDHLGIFQLISHFSGEHNCYLADG